MLQSVKNRRSQSLLFFITLKVNTLEGMNTSRDAYSVKFANYTCRKYSFGQTTCRQSHAFILNLVIFRDICGVEFANYAWSDIC